jgi:hypothetical protein
MRIPLRKRLEVGLVTDGVLGSRLPDLVLY